MVVPETAGGWDLFGHMPLDASQTDLYPAPNGTDFGDGTALASTPAVKSINDHYFVTRLDHQFSANQSLFGRYLIQTGVRNDPNDNGIGKFPEVDPFRTQLLTVG